jgi:serine/threonine-protein kinase
VNYGRYQILREVGRGSMGVVYQARDPQIDRMVALKVLRQDRVSTDAFVKRFLKEAKVIGRLSHPNIVTIYDVGEEQGNVYIAMEFLEGKSLSDILLEKHPAPKEVMEIGVQIAETLDYAHSKGVIHRDIKPSNIIIAPDGRIRITDFGIARIEDSTATLHTQAGEILGTPAYMSPEQVSGQQVDGRSDIFSLGVILYEMTTGARPFGGKGNTLASMFNDIIRVTPPEPFITSSLVPKKLSALIMKALQKGPEKRFQTGRELAEALRECARKTEPPANINIPAAEKKKNYGMPIAVTIAVAILAVGIYYLYSHMKEPGQRRAVKQQNALPPKEMSTVPVLGPKQDKTLTVPAPESAINRKPAEETIVKKEMAPPPSAVHEQRQPAYPRGTEVKKQAPLRTATKPASMLVPLTLRSTPQGASVYIDDSVKGKTPLTLMISTGKHRIRLSMAGYRDAGRQIVIEETMEYPLMFNLTSVNASGE